MVAQASDRPLFSLGQIVATPGALAALEAAGESPAELLGRHVRGDWGQLSDDDREANHEALRSGGRILSNYTTRRGTRIWIITEANRAATTLLLPEEY
jgi:hypothetical protein